MQVTILAMRIMYTPHLLYQIETSCVQFCYESLKTIIVDIYDVYEDNHLIFCSS